MISQESQSQGCVFAFGLESSFAHIYSEELVFLIILRTSSILGPGEPLQILLIQF